MADNLNPLKYISGITGAVTAGFFMPAHSVDKLFMLIKSLWECWSAVRPQVFLYTPETLPTIFIGRTQH